MGLRLPCPNRWAGKKHMAGYVYGSMPRGWYSATIYVGVMSGMIVGLYVAMSLTIDAPTCINPFAYDTPTKAKLAMVHANICRCFDPAPTSSNNMQLATHLAISIGADLAVDRGCVADALGYMLWLQHDSLCKLVYSGSLAQTCGSPRWRWLSQLLMRCWPDRRLNPTCMPMHTRRKCMHTMHALTQGDPHHGLVL